MRGSPKIIYASYIIDKIHFKFSHVSWGFTHLLYNKFRGILKIFLADIAYNTIYTLTS